MAANGDNAGTIYTIRGFSPKMMEKAETKIFIIAERWKKNVDVILNIVGTNAR